MRAGLAASPTCWGASELLGRVSYFIAFRMRPRGSAGMEIVGEVKGPQFPH